MANQVVPTKGNLMATKKSLELARLGYDLLDKKRNVLIKEMMSLLDDVKEIRDDITDSYDRAYAALREANESLGIISDVYRLANNIRKTQKRANALQNISIPRFEATVKMITEALDEKDREEFSRQKVIKAQKNRQEAAKRKA